MEDKSTQTGCWLVGFSILFQIFQIFQPSHAHNINCTVTQDGGWTLYAVPRMEEAKHCLYSWFNMTGHVLANHEAQMDELVETNTNCSLCTRECIPIVRYEQNCLSEMSLHEAFCNTSCTESTNPNREDGNIHHHWIFAISTIVTVCVFLFCIFKICRREAVEEQENTQNNRHKTKDVDARRA